MEMSSEPTYVKKLQNELDYATEVSFCYLVSLAKSEKSITEQRKKCAEALELFAPIPTNPELLISIVDCYFMLGKYIVALELLEEGIKKGWKLPDIVEYKGKCLFKLGEYERAIIVFKEAIDIGASARECGTWLMRCKAHFIMDPERGNLEYHKDRVITIEPHVVSEVKHDWYQSKTDVTLVIYCSGVSEDNVAVLFGDNRVYVLITGKESIRAGFHLEKEVNQDEIRINVGKTKIEIKMTKLVPNQTWKL